MITGRASPFAVGDLGLSMGLLFDSSSTAAIQVFSDDFIPIQTASAVEPHQETKLHVNSTLKC